jgi:hypothetical protein
MRQCLKGPAISLGFDSSYRCCLHENRGHLVRGCSSKKHNRKKEELIYLTLVTFSGLLAEEEIGINAQLSYRDPQGCHIRPGEWRGEAVANGFQLSRDKSSQERVRTEQGLAIDEVDGEANMGWAEDLREAITYKGQDPTRFGVVENCSSLSEMDVRWVLKKVNDLSSVA